MIALIAAAKVNFILCRHKIYSSHALSGRDGLGCVNYILWLKSKELTFDVSVSLIINEKPPDFKQSKAHSFEATVKTCLSTKNTAKS